MRPVPKPVVVVRTSDRKSVFQSIFLREAVFREAVTAVDVKAGLKPKR
jgi:hypothetical protein